MKQIRVELQLVAIVHVGDDIAEGAAPSRAPDATTSVTLARVATVGMFLPTGEAVGNHLSSLMVNSAPVIGERLRHALRERGL